MAPDRSLTEAFLAALPADRRGTELADSEPTLLRTVEAARQAWPPLDLDPVEFVRFLASRCSGDEELGTTLARLHVSDLWLAFGCTRQLPVALAEFDRSFLAKVPASLSKMNLDSAAIDDLVQALRQRLLVPEPGAAAPIATYGGRGSLGGWLAAAAVRAAIDLKRATQPRAPDGDERLAELASPALDPDAEYIRRRCGPEFKQAFQEALAGLSDQDRLLLRLSYLDRVSIDKLGDLFQVHRSTAARWLARCREELFEKTRALLRERLRLTDSEFASLAQALQSQLDVSINRFLAAKD